MSNTLTHTCRLWNLYGPAETTIDCTFHLFNNTTETESFPIGRPLSNDQNLVLDQFSQSVPINQEGELFVGGMGVFAGYIGRDDLTAKALVEIDGQLFYRTGDLVTMDSNGLLHYQGRKDHQIKLHGQRIELGEIERCLLNITFISACVVMKWNDNHLVAYVQSSHSNEQRLRQHCQSHLPPHMIPSIFIILDKLPLNSNGKIDRKQLPSPRFSSIHLTNGIELALPTNDMEVSIHHIWCEIFKLNQISADTNIFTIGGHSLLMMQLFHRYKIEFHLETNALSISNLFQYPTIIHHAQLIQQSINTIHTLDDHPWSPLHLIQARASFAQERIYLDEQIRFSSNKTTMNNMYVIPLLYRISSIDDHVSITRFHRAFQSVITKHNILRTVLYIDDTNGNITQHCLDANIVLNDDMKSYGLTIVNLHNDDRRHMNESIEEILNQSDLFDLSKGRVIRFHILRRYHQSQDNISYENDDLLSENDHILISIHHAMFDGASTSIFIRDLSLAYQSDDSVSTDDKLLNYIDYSVHEYIMDMSLSREFWHSQLEEYNIKCSLSLPFDRQRSSNNQQRSGSASTAEIIFDNEICTSFLNYASSHHLTLFQLGLSIFYAFLFKLTHSQTDLCIGSINANRYRSELVNMIGMFVSTLPYRLEIDSSWSFDELVQHVREKCLSILEHSHYPLQHILSDLHLTQSSVSFLETVFDFITISKDVGGLRLNGINLEQVSLQKSYKVAKFDFSLNFIYNSLSDDNQLCCYFVCSRDLFDEKTVNVISQRFQHVLEQLFSMNSNINQTDFILSPITKLRLILSEEIDEMERIVFCRQSDITNEAPASYAQARIWLDERIRFDSKNSQVAIYNMPFLHRLSSGGTLSISKLRQALQHVLMKHSSLRTSLYFDTNKNILMQKIIDHTDNKELFTFIESTFETDEDLNKIMHNERGNPNSFNLLTGVVCRCHVVYYKNMSQKGIICEKDALIFNFHHALFDFPSVKMFRQDLDQAYTMGYLENDDNTTLRYLDYAVAEQQMAMTAANAFWLDALRDCEIDRPLQLTFDRHRVSDEHRTGRGTSISFQFDNDLSKAFLTYASTYNIKLEYLALASYYTFLFKLANNENDICIVMNNHGRSKPELMSIIGMFVNALPMRCQIHSNHSFDEFVKYVQTIATQTFEHSYFPLQRILAQHSHISRPTFLDVFFGFVSFSTEHNHDEVTVGGVPIYTMPYSIQINTDEIASKFDFSLSIIHDTITDQLSCSIEASLDLFNPSTTYKIGQRFQILLQQLFTSNVINETCQSIHESSIILPNEKILIASTINTQTLFSSSNHCIQHEFIQQVNKQPQKIAIKLDEQSLTYNELLYYAQCLSLEFLTNSNYIPGNVVGQCIDRSISMFIGMLSIIMAGGSYCPLSPRDHEHRLQSLIEQTRSNIVLVDWTTQNKFEDKTMMININTMIINNNNETINTNHLDLFSTFTINSKNVAFVIFTSGSTGTPKAVQIMHRNLLNCMSSFNDLGILTKDDTVIQMAQCTFDVHVKECLGTLLVGGSVVQLHPEGTMDYNYLSKTLQQHHITFFGVVPSVMTILYNYLIDIKQLNRLDTIRKFGFLGEAIDTRTLAKMINYFDVNTTAYYNLYGPAETTLTSIYHRVIIHEINDGIIAIGIPFPNMQVHLIDSFNQSVIVGQEGELLISGSGVFAGYLGRDDLTSKALVEINKKQFYQTGDLARMNSNGLVYYLGRKDHQVKIHGQRIELDEIQRCLLDTSISACVAIKWGNDHLIAYVQSNDNNVEYLRDHCRSRLPPFMVPSMFIVLGKFPLNANGKLDRKLLPQPNFSSSSMKTTDIQHTNPNNSIEEKLLSIWCEILHRNNNNEQDEISTSANFFTVGGHSLLFIQLYHRYQSIFSFTNELLPIALFLQKTTIIEHAKLLESIKSTDVVIEETWQSLHLIKGMASFAQERIYLDQQVRFMNNVSVYNELMILKLINGTLSKSRLQRAIQSVLEKHQILRTCLILDTDAGTLTQCVTQNHLMFMFNTEKT
ncbi:unnamed protein product, partial [Adineta steineri]